MRLRMMFIALVLVLGSACTPEELEWWGYAPKEAQDIVTIAIIHSAAEEFGADPHLMVRIARCESGLRPDAINTRSGASGLFQHLPRYWPGRAEHFLGDRNALVLDPSANARVSAAMLAAGGQSHWAESRRCWSR